MKNEWDNLPKKVDEQKIKQRIYDDIFVDWVKKDIVDTNVLDFGIGTGEIAERLVPFATLIQGYDESINMRESAGLKIGHKNIYDSLSKIPTNKYDILLSSLVICIVNEKTLGEIMESMSGSLKPNGIAYFGFCNPHDFDVPETKLQRRIISNKSYREKHCYQKIIKEGNFRITEQHRPLDFYEQLFHNYQFHILDQNHSTPETIRGRTCSDFIMYKLKKI